MATHKTALRPALRAGWCLVALLGAALLLAAGGGRPSPLTLAATPTPGRAGHDTTDACCAPGGDLQFEHLSLEDGLSQASVYAILQDRQGFLWFGTQDGLNRYDGYQFQVYRPRAGDPNSLGHQFVRALYEDAQGDLWIGTDGGGLNRLDRQTGQIARYQPDPANPESLSGAGVYALCGGREGQLWVGTENGLDLFDPATETSVHFSHDPQDAGSLTPGAIRAICEDQAGRLWIGSGGGGLDCLDPATGQLSHYRHDATDGGSLGDDAVLALLEDRSGTLWVGTEWGLDRLDGATGRFQHFRHDPRDARSLGGDAISALYEDGSGALWVGTMGGGLSRFDPQSGQFSRYQADVGDPGSLSHDFVSAVFEDRAGVLWVGTLGSGVDYSGCAPRPFTLYQASAETENSLSENVLWSVCEDREGALWVGTFGGGLDRLDRESGEWAHYRHDPADPNSLSHDVVRAVREDGQGVLWVGTEGGGLDRLDPATGRFAHYRHNPRDPSSLSHDGVLTLYVDGEDVLWVGTRAGLNRLERATGRFVRYLHDAGDPGSLSHSTVRAIYEDRTGTLWVGTPHGLNRLDRDAGQFTHYLADAEDANALSCDDILSIYEDRGGTLWVGTFGGGLNRFDRATGAFAHYDERDGLPSAVVYGILEESGGPGSPPGPLWLSTNGGLSRFDPGTETFTNYDVRDGLQSNEFNAGAYYESESGEMFFGGVNGLSSFYPDGVRSNAYVPPIVLTALHQPGADATPGAPAERLQQVTVRWPNNSFEFEFAALSYCQPERNQYAYRLEGFDRAWVSAGTQRLGRYTNLPGGTYTLRIRGSNNDGVWSDEGLALPVTVVPPFWATGWFRGLAALLVVAGAVAGLRLRVRAVERRSRELERQVGERTAALQREMTQRVELERALRQSEAERAVVEERTRLARDLHDSVTQSLYALTLYADAAARLLTSGQAGAVETNLQKLRRTAREALGEMRLLIFELRPPVLAQEGLAGALRSRLEAVEGRAGVRTELRVEGECDLPASVEEGLYRIAVEALNNALKHARAQRIAVSLELGPGEARLEVADDGVGFHPGAAQSCGGMGLQGMGERAERMGGQLAVHSAPGEGTRVTVVWRRPLEERAR